MVHNCMHAVSIVSLFSALHVRAVARLAGVHVCYNREKTELSLERPTSCHNLLHVYALVVFTA